MIRFVLIFILFIYFALEFAAFGYFARHFGLLGCFVEIMVSLVVGARILGSQPKEMMQALQLQVSKGGDPRLLLLGGLRLLIAGLLLVLPGLMTDFIGLWLFISGRYLQSTQAEPSSSPWREECNSNEGQGFEEAWRGDEFEQRLRNKGRPANQSDIVDATIISTDDNVNNRENKP